MHSLARLLKIPPALSFFPILNNFNSDNNLLNPRFYDLPILVSPNNASSLQIAVLITLRQHFPSLARHASPLTIRHFLAILYDSTSPTRQVKDLKHKKG